jgi:hypothetical protein
VNRLASITETGGATNWACASADDPYGNSWVQSANHTLPFATPVAQLSGDRHRPAAYSGQ